LLAIASCSFPFLEKWKGICEKNKPCAFIDSVLSGFAQIAFSDNTFSGILLLAAIFIGSPTQAVSALWATFVGTLAAYLIGIPKGLIRGGFYGFNAVLSGLILPLLVFPGQGVTLGLLVLSTLAGLMCTLLGAALGSFFGKWEVPALAAPFCLTIFILVPASLLFSTLGAAPFAPAVATSAAAPAGYSITEVLLASLNGIAQVLLLGKPVCGLLYLVAVLFSSRIDALNSIVGVLLGTAAAIALGLPKDAVMAGLYGFNAILLMHIMARAFVPSVKSYLLSMVCAGFTSVLAAALQVILAPLGLPSFLAIPYVAICIAVLLGRSLYKGLTYVPPQYWGVPETIRRDLKSGKILLQD